MSFPAVQATIPWRAWNWRSCWGGHLPVPHTLEVGVSHDKIKEACRWVLYVYNYIYIFILTYTCRFTIYMDICTYFIHTFHAYQNQHARIITLYIIYVFECIKKHTFFQTRPTPMISNETLFPYWFFLFPRFVGVDSEVLLLMAEILHQLIGSLSQLFTRFIHPGWCRISSINSIKFKSLVLILRSSGRNTWSAWKTVWAPSNLIEMGWFAPYLMDLQAV